ncbi:hypothetical protein ASPCADRAFT_3486 [Aspergillus carbonarius ITEM 5010]|uniref:Uncharacterized protein n=1 Tax=Aspergillus carbonarius (strain ITEM 5010) TaxID=602072 RepID=A0A1R3RVA1_ASPC5|nr:hypothetical protein ASPCADRAFT_3486 [Aspergillus carbonarius ITEM 5010]
MAVGIHGFSETSKAFREFVDLMIMHRPMTKDYNHWIYFPLDGQERILGVWIQQWEEWHGPPIVVLQTSPGRTVILGSLFPFNVGDVYDYHRLVTPSDGSVLGFIHNGLDPAAKCISAVGVTCSGQGHAGGLEPLPASLPCEAPTVFPSQIDINDTWYLSNPPLKGLVKVQVCRD